MAREAPELNTDLPTIEKSMTETFERKLAESADQIMLKMTSRLTTLDAKIKTKIKFLRNAAQTRLASLSKEIVEKNEQALQDQITTTKRIQDEASHRSWCSHQLIVFRKPKQHKH
jgi:hypothetical protein